ncbi:hypothetical protein CWM52_12355 [Raoultella sp. T31]|nr:hypothetical protein CWM52_12355 [Raoultella sp. T31]
MTAEAEKAAAQSVARARDLANIGHPFKIKIMFLFYETLFYFLRNIVLVIKIVIICFKKHGTAGRDHAQQKGPLSPLFR